MNKIKEFYSKYLSIEVEPLNRFIFWVYGVAILVISIIDVAKWFNYISEELSLVLFTITWVSANYVYIKLNNEFYSKGRRKKKAILQITLLSILIIGIKILFK